MPEIRARQARNAVDLPKTWRDNAAIAKKSTSDVPAGMGDAACSCNRLGRIVLLQRHRVRELPVFTVVVSRVGLAAIILLVLMRLRGERMPRDRRVWCTFFGMGLLNNAIPFLLIVRGISISPRAQPRS